MSKIMTPVNWQACSAEAQQALLARPALSASDSISQIVRDVLARVKSEGDAALRDFSARFDKVELTDFRVTAEQMQAASDRLSDELKQAMAVAVANIETFHRAQILPAVDIETQPGVRCQQVTRPMQSVGLYIPGGPPRCFPPY